jgi:GTP-binding protein
VVSLSGWRQFVVADIPGILEGAHEGKGLGLEFLRHVERTRVLLFLVDLTSPAPERDLETVRAELAHHAGDLLRRPYLVLLTKADLVPSPEIPEGLRGRDDVRVISAVRGDGVDPLLDEVYDLVQRARDGGAA